MAHHVPGSGLRVLAALLDVFAVLMIVQLSIQAVSRIAPDQDIRLLERIATLEKRLSEARGTPGPDDDRALILVTRQGDLLCLVHQYQEPVRTRTEDLSSWLQTHTLPTSVEVAGEQGADYQRVCRTAEAIQRTLPEARIYFGAGVRR